MSLGSKEDYFILGRDHLQASMESVGTQDDTGEQPEAFLKLIFMRFMSDERAGQFIRMIVFVSRYVFITLAR